MTSKRNLRESVGKSHLEREKGASDLGLGGRFRQLRQERRWTLEHLADSTGLSISTLSKIENDQVSASFDTIMKVAQALGCRFEELFGLPGKDTLPLRQEPIAGRRTFTRRGQGLPFRTAYYDYDVHSAELLSKGMIPLVMRIRTREVPDSGDWSTHSGEEFIYVVKGATELHTELYAPLRLETGDSAYIDSTMRHAFVSVGVGDAEILSICLTEGLSFDGTTIGRAGYTKPT